jgi:hypothetical protein
MERLSAIAERADALGPIAEAAVLSAIELGRTRRRRRVRDRRRPAW